ncbi:MAG: TonB family protein [Opitutaceae bacterium]
MLLCTPVAVRGILLAALFLVPLARAQDATFGEILWAGEGPAPDTMPIVKSRARPDYPEEMLKADVPGYVLVSLRIDSSGKRLGFSALGSHLSFQRAVEASFPDWGVTPAKNAGKPVASNVWVRVVFNPKSAEPGAPDATARLLQPTLIKVDVSPTPAGHTPLARVRVDLDAAGVVTGVEAVDRIPDNPLSSIRQSLQSWRFAPARKNGEPVASGLELSVLCLVSTPAAPTDFVAAKPVRQKAPVFPDAMRRNGIRGEVAIDFWVDEKGSVQNCSVAECDNPAVEGPALTALREWKYAPATRGGKPVATQLRVAIAFGIGDAPGGGESAVSIEARGDPSKLRPELRYDTTAKVRGVIAPVYPYAQRRDHVRGKARAAVLIDPQGQVAAVKILSADQPEFGLAFTAALEGYKFDPASKEGKAVPQIVNLEQIFTEGALPDQVADGLLALEKKQPEKIAEPSALDSPLRLVSRRAAFLPTAPGLSATGGEAVVECLIAQDGRAHLSRIVSATHPAFGYAAVQASSTWWFEPPKAGGKPAVVRARLPFKFSAGATQPGPPAQQAK